MIVGIGIDAVEIARIDELLRKYPAAARRRVFTAAERRDAGRGRGAAASLAARFAAKEAAMKALGTGWAEGVGFADIEVHREPSGAPRLELHGAAARRARKLAATALHVTMSHTRTTAVAVVVIEGSGRPSRIRRQ